MFSTYQCTGHRHVVPEDALGPIREDWVDLRRHGVGGRGCGSDGRPVPLIVSYPPGEVRALELMAIDASTVDAAVDGSAWRESLTGASTVRLDGRVSASLDRGTRQIGAPTAWDAGLTGEGVKVAGGAAPPARRGLGVVPGRGDRPEGNTVEQTILDAYRLT